MQRSIRRHAGFAAVLLAMLMASSAYGYTGQVIGDVTIAVVGATNCATPTTLSATVTDALGTPLAGESVAWSFVTSPSSSDAINATPTTTNSSGVATTTVTLAPVDGNRTVRATAGEFSASVVLSPVCQGGLPNTSTAPSGTDLPVGPILLIVLGLFLAAGFGLTRRGSVSSR
jgi:hypothetical protein